MKKMHNSLRGTSILGAGLAAVFALSASAAEKGLYFNAEGGVNFANDADISSGGPAVKAEFDPGFRAGVGVGYNFNHFVGVEFDTGWIWNQIDTVGGFSPSGDFNFFHVPFMGNVVFRYENSSKFVPYIGAGLGGTYSILDIDTPGLNDSDGDVVFSWQALAGVRYMFNDNMSIGVGYKYHGTADSTFTFNGTDLEVSNVHNHAFSVVFQMTF